MANDFIQSVPALAEAEYQVNEIKKDIEEREKTLEQYLFIDVKESKFLPFWSVLLFLALFAEIILVPFTYIPSNLFEFRLCSLTIERVLSKTRPAEMAVDIFFIFNMFINCFSGRKVELSEQDLFKKSAEKVHKITLEDAEENSGEKNLFKEGKKKSFDRET